MDNMCRQFQDFRSLQVFLEIHHFLEVLGFQVVQLDQKDLLFRVVLPARVLHCYQVLPVVQLDQLDQECLCPW